jgi:hypothetical protein
MANAILKLKTVKHPISEDVIGFRIQAAIPNRAAKAFGKAVPSFKRPFFLAETSDHSEAYLQEHFEEVLDSFKANLKWQGYDTAEFVQ